MAGLLYHVGRICARHHWVLIGVWLALAAGLVVTARGVGSQTSDDLTLPGTGSTLAMVSKRSER